MGERTEKQKSDLHNELARPIVASIVKPIVRDGGSAFNPTTDGI